MSKLLKLQNDFKQGLTRLEEIPHLDPSEVVRDAGIKRFEFTFDLAWKYLKAKLEEEKGVICRSPKDCFRQAYTQKLIAYDDFWLVLTDLRNQAVHLYEKHIAEEIFGKLPDIIKHFKSLL